MNELSKQHGIDWRHFLLLGLTLFPALALFALVEPIAQPQEYHDFADSRRIIGVPNFADVASNLAFMLTGLAGVAVALIKPVGPGRYAWVVMFSGIALVALGSGYYHLDPSDESLVWDRVAMTVGFMGLFTALLVEYISVRLGVLLLPLVIVGIGSVFYGYYFEDLRWYLCVQFIPLLMVPILVVFFRSSHTHQWLLPVGLAWYMAAKVAEFNDPTLFQLTGEVISGHTAKHLLAALGCLTVLIMLWKRRPD